MVIEHGGASVGVGAVAPNLLGLDFDFVVEYSADFVVEYLAMLAVEVS